jgi:hypothetical protein
LKHNEKERSQVQRESIIERFLREDSLEANSLFQRLEERRPHLSRGMKFPRRLDWGCPLHTQVFLSLKIGLLLNESLFFTSF